MPTSTTTGLAHSLDYNKEGIAINATRKEQWRPIPGWEGYYEVSDHGRVRSIKRAYRTQNKILRPRPNKNGYLRVALCRDSKSYERRVHQLVLETFVGKRPPGHVACHWDDDKSNNHIDNLRWGTHSDNMQDRVRNGKHPLAARVKCKRGHLLAGPNLYEHGGMRCCKSCRYARRAQTRFPHHSVQHLSDLKYKELMNDRSN